MNLIYIFADQWRSQAAGFQNEDAVYTPHIDEFAKESLVFSNAVSTFPLCSPHRASLMTGKYPFCTGMWTNCKTGLSEVLMLKPQENCIGNVLKEAGYQTGYIGKWHLDASEMNFETHPASGAKDWDAYTPPGERRQGFDFWLSYGADDHHLDPHYWNDSGQMIRPGKWSPEFETDQALSYLQRHSGQDQPFALFLSYNPPHLPYELVPEKYLKGYRNMPVKFRENVPAEKRTRELANITRQYYAAVTGIDDQFGRILAFLKENNLEENTLLVLSADHGEMLGSHGRMSKNIWYEEAVSIPLLMRQKGSIPQGEYPEIFASPDHMPTLLGLLDLEVPQTCQGYNHAKNIRGQLEGAPEQAFLCSYPGMPELVCAFEKAGINHKCYGWRGIRTKRHTYVRNNGYMPGDAREAFLYDNEKDPYQMHPLSEEDTEKELLEYFHEQLRRYLNMTKDPFLW